MRAGPWLHGISDLIKRTPELVISLPLLHEDMRRWPSVSQKESPHQEPNQLAPNIGLSTVQNYEK